MTQMPLDFTAPAVRDSATSCAAANSIAPTAGSLRARVLERLQSHGVHGATDEELQTWLSMNPSTERPRRIELVEKGLVRDSGRTRATRSGRHAVVWVAVFAGGVS